MPGAFQSCELLSTTESSSAQRKCWCIKKAGSFPCLPFSRRRQASTLALSSVCAQPIQKKSAHQLIAKRAVDRSCLALPPPSLLSHVEARDARLSSPDRTLTPSAMAGVFIAHPAWRQHRDGLRNVWGRPFSRAHRWRPLSLPGPQGHYAKSASPQATNAVTAACDLRYQSRVSEPGLQALGTYLAEGSRGS